MKKLSALVLSRSTILAFATMGAGWGSFAASVPDFKLAVAADDGLFGRLLLGSPVGLMLAVALAPRVDRAFGARAMPGAAMAFGLAVLLPGLAAGIGPASVFACAMFALAFCSGTLDVVMNVRVSEREVESGRSLMNLNHAMFSFAYAGGAIIAGVIREAGLPALYAAAVVAALAALAVRYMVQPVASAEDGAEPLVLGSAIWPVALAGGVVLVAFMIENGVEVWSALHIERTLGGRAAEGALGPAILGLTMGFGRLAGQGMAERLSESRVMLLASLLTSGGLIVAAQAAVPFVAYLGFGAAGLGVSVIAPMALALIGRSVPRSLRSRAIAIAAGVGFAGYFVGAPMIGQLSDGFGLRVALSTLAGCALVVPLLLAGLRRIRRPV